MEYLLNICIYERPLSEHQPGSELTRSRWRLKGEEIPRLPGDIYCGYVASDSHTAKPDWTARLRILRCGTANVFWGIEPKAGVLFTKVTRARSSPEFADIIFQIDEYYPGADTIHLVPGNLSTHSRKAWVDRFSEEAGGWL